MNKYTTFSHLKAFVAATCCSLALQAGEGGYFVTYSSKIEKGEKTLMLMNDFTRPSELKRHDGQNDYNAQMLELEWHPTDQYATEIMFESFIDANGEKKYTGFRWENRYRLFKDETFLNPMIYVEYENLHRATRFKMETSGWVITPYLESQGDEPLMERILESRLVLSQDVGRTNIAFNWINETDLRTGRTDFGYALGVAAKDVVQLLGGSKAAEG